jgi:TRAP-type C4-dicarboxylate transport system permease small subunit
MVVLVFGNMVLRYVLNSGITILEVVWGWIIVCVIFFCRSMERRERRP